MGKNKKIAVFPGSFDPITVGHVEIVSRGLLLFDEIIIAIGINTEKKTMFTQQQRLDWIQKIFKKQPQVKCKVYSGMTIDFCKKESARFILRGLRSSLDFEYERIIGQMNRTMTAGIETVFLTSAPEHSHIASTVVREIIRSGGDATLFLPKGLIIPR